MVKTVSGGRRREGLFGDEAEEWAACFTSEVLSVAAIFRGQDSEKELPKARTKHLDDSISSIGRIEAFGADD